MAWSWLANNTFATWVTAAIIAYYTIETARMRKQLVLQNERSVLPLITVEFDEDDFRIRNIGTGPALNLSIDPLKLNESPKLEVLFAIAPSLGPGEVDSMIYNTAVGGDPSSNRLSWGKTFFPRLTTQRRHLVIRFQTLDGKAYKQDITIRPTSQSVRPVELSAVVPDKGGPKKWDKDEPGNG